jgi:Ni/Co efflux regulator RcnB
MKYFVTAVLALALAGAAASVQADPPPDKHDHKDTHADHAAPPPKKPDVVAKNKQRTVDREDARLHSEQRTVNSEDARLHSEQRNVNNADARVHREQAAVNHDADHGHPGLGYQSHGLRANDHGRVAYSVNVYPQRFTVARRFHIDSYAYPGGWYARSWNYGDRLPDGWFAPQFYLNFGLYGLTTPPIGCEWVREGPDAVLVDIYTGQVLSVASGVFY